MRRVLMPVLSVLLLASCQNKEALDAPQLSGLWSGEGMTFSLIHDGRGVSILYDSARVEAIVGGRIKPGDTVSRGRQFMLANRMGKGVGLFWVRGAAEGSVETAKLAFTVAGEPIDLTRQLGGGNFTACFEAALSENNTPVTWVASVVTPEAGESALIDIDSIDLLVQPEGTSGLGEQGCPPPPPTSLNRTALEISSSATIPHPTGPKGESRSAR